MSAEPPSSPDSVAPERLRQGHRAVGIALMDVFAGAPWRVELEQELALKSQLLDVAIIEATGEGSERQPPAALPARRFRAVCSGHPVSVQAGRRLPIPSHRLGRRSMIDPGAGMWCG